MLGALTAAYGPAFLRVAIPTAIAVALLGIVVLTVVLRARGDHPKAWALSLIVIVGLVAGIGAGALSTTQKIAGLQRSSGSDFTLDEQTNRFAHQTELDTAAFADLLAQVPAERRAEIGRAFAGKDLTARQDVRREQGFTTSEVLAYYVGRITEHNPYYRSILELDPRAIEQAATTPGGDPAQPLRGAIVFVKGNTAIAGLTNDSGSWALANITATNDADIVTALRQAGAIVVGRTNLSEFSNYMTISGPNGFSARGGQTLSPFSPLQVDPLGSSSGSATAIALDFADLTVGTETSGSVIAPARAAGVYALKAAHPDCSIAGIVPIDDRVDSVGFLGRSVTDITLAAETLCGVGTAEPAAQPRVMTIGERSEQLTAAVQRAGVTLIDAPQEVTDLVAQLEEGQSFDILSGGIKPSLDRHAAATGSRTLSEVVDYLNAHPEHAPYGTQLLTKGAEATPETIAKSEQVLTDFKAKVAELNALLAKENVVALASVHQDLAVLSLAGVPRMTLPLYADEIVGTASPQQSVQITATDPSATAAMAALAKQLAPGLPAYPVMEVPTTVR